MTQTATRKHWLDKVTPAYWTGKGYWRARATHQGKSFQWLLKNGKSDPSSTGKAMAFGEWAKLRSQLKAEEAKGNDPTDPKRENYENWTDEEQVAHEVANDVRHEYNESGFSHLVSFEEWKQIDAWLTAKRSGQTEALNGTPVDVAVAPLAKKFGDLIDSFLSHIDERYQRTQTNSAKQLKTNDSMSWQRKQKYDQTAGEMKSAIGNTLCTPVADFLISEKCLATILETWRNVVTKQFNTGKNDKGQTVSGHWFNERMKTARSLCQWIVDNRLGQQMPANIDALTTKFTTEKNSLPIPLEVVRIYWQEAEEALRGYMSLALNCGFRQIEIAGLEPKHVKNIGGQLAIDKARGKTGVPYTLPLWKRSELFIRTYGNKSGWLFVGKRGMPVVHEATDSIGLMFRRMRTKAIKNYPEMAKELTRYSFQNFRDTGASFLEQFNPILVPLYLAEGDGRTAKHYIGKIVDTLPEGATPQNMGEALSLFEKWLCLP